MNASLIGKWLGTSDILPEFEVCVNNNTIIAVRDWFHCDIRVKIRFMIIQPEEKKPGKKVCVGAYAPTHTFFPEVLADTIIFK
jgi:hypothetical protein